MVRKNDTVCPKCKGQLKHYDVVKRPYKTKGGKIRSTIINRSKCSMCGSVHREIPEFIFPFKRYEPEVIYGVIEGFITPDILGYEDYPCEQTMIRWKTQYG